MLMMPFRIGLMALFFLMILLGYRTETVKSYESLRYTTPALKYIIQVKDFLKIANPKKVQPDDDICGGDEIYLEDFVLNTTVNDDNGI